MYMGDIDVLQKSTIKKDDDSETRSVILDSNNGHHRLDAEAFKVIVIPIAVDTGGRR